MEAMAQEWTEGRLDELSAKVDRGFEQVDAGIGSLRLEMRTEFTAIRDEMNGMRGEINGVPRGEINGIRGEIAKELGKMTARIDSVQRTIAFGAVALTGAILAGFSAMCALIAAAL
jgi:hypothetical protein